eukprot:g14065.t1
MFSGSLGEEQDNAMQRRILLRRQRDEERRIRLLNAKQRVMGRDTAALEKQIEEKKAARAAEKSAEALYNSTNAAIRNVLEEENLRVKEEEVLRSMELQNAWDIQLATKEYTLTHRLNDPNELKNEGPARQGDYDPRCGPSSMQMFSGEDLRKGDRIKMQQMQMRDWTEQQKAERASKKQADADEAKSYFNYMKQVEGLRNEMEKKEAEEKMQQEILLAQENANLRDQRAQRDLEYKQMQRNLDQETANYTLNNPMLLERRDQAKSRFPGRVRRDHWKGMTVNQLKDIQMENERIIAENKARRAEEKRIGQLEGKLSDGIVDVLQQQYDNEQQAAAERRIRLQQDLLVQAREKKMRDKILNEQLNTNKIGDGFFNRFGQNCR